MIKTIFGIISKTYNERLESLCTRILYFFNTIDTYYLLAGIISYLSVVKGSINIPVLLVTILFVTATAKICDFYPVFAVSAVPVMIAMAFGLNLPAWLLLRLLFINCIVFFTVQFLFMGLPDSIVARDIKVAFIKIWNSLFTVAPTTVSFLMSVFFSFYLSFYLLAAASANSHKDYLWLISSAVLLLTAAGITRLSLPKNHFSKFHKPDIKDKPIFRRVVVLNIDGVRKDVFDALDLPEIGKLSKEAASHTRGLETVYRALTNPAFASIFTGTVPEIHGVRNNNLGQSIKTEGLPDIVPSIAYGSMHVKHFCKEHWKTRIVSLPRHSVYKSDAIMVEWLKDDMLNNPEIRLFVADFSEADFLAHAYGSKSRQYKQALQRIDKKIGDFIAWMRIKNMFKDTAVIICSDHGIAAIDHSYLIADSEKYVPFLAYGNGIKKNLKITRPGKIMDICCTIAYLLGVRYPKDCRGQVFTEILEDEGGPAAKKEEMVKRFNQVKYEIEAKDCLKHTEIYEGDKNWWDQCICNFIKPQAKSLRVLDIGCGNGFVGTRFLDMGVKFNDFICLDISEQILEAAKKTLGNNPGFSFVKDIDGITGKFDVVTVSSVFHHIVNPVDLSEKIDSLLDKQGILIASHEPNKQAFNNKLFYLAACMYKKIGGAITIDDKFVEQFNILLRDKYPAAGKVCREEILQTVEYHSPLEQYDSDIDIECGFIPQDFCKSYFPGYNILALEDYTTFFHRSWLSRHKNIQWLMDKSFKTLFKQGNLFRLVLKKT